MRRAGCATEAQRASWERWALLVALVGGGADGVPCCTCGRRGQTVHSRSHACAREQSEPGVRTRTRADERCALCCGGAAWADF